MCKDFSWGFASTVSISLDCPQPPSVCVCVCVCARVRMLFSPNCWWWRGCNNIAIAEIKPIFFSPVFKALCV